PDPEACDELLRLGKGAVDDARLAGARELDALGLRRRVQPLAGEHDTRFHELFVELRHLSEHALARHYAVLAVFVGLDGDEDSHGESPVWIGLLYNHVE